VSPRHVISAISNQPVNAPPTRRSRNGSRASTVQKQHGVSGKARKHLYETMAEFFEKNLK
jgi:hypothetical protein